MQAHFAWAPMFVVLFVGVAVIALVLTGIVALVRNPRTRVFGIMLLLTMPLALVAVLIGFLFVARSEVHTASVQYSHSGPETIRMDDGRQIRRMGEDRWEVIDRPRYTMIPSHPDDTATDEVAEAETPDGAVGSGAILPSPPPSTKPQTTARALANSLVDTIRKQTREREETLKRQANKALEVTVGKTIPLEAETADSDPAAKPRPDWLDRPARTDQVVVTVGPHSSRPECDEDLRRTVQQETEKYSARYLRDEDTARQIQLPADVLQKIVKETYAERVNASYGPWVRVHALLEFDKDVRNEIDRQRHHVLVNHRVRHAGGGLAGMLLFLGIAWGYLRIDMATRGAYRNRLRALAAVLMVALAVAGLALVG